MLNFSYDPENRALYIYFVELEAGRAAYVLEYPAALWLDRNGRIFGATVDLDDEVLLSMLEVALEPIHNWLDGERGRLIVRIADEEPAQIRRLDSSAILDLDRDDLILGIEMELPADLPADALERLQPFMIELEAEPEAISDGPVVFAPPIETADEDGEFADEDAEFADEDAEFADEDAKPSAVIAAGPGAQAAVPQPGPPLDATPIKAGFVALVGEAECRQEHLAQRT
ncbi:MAG: GTPase Era, partial [Oscillochloris sp.]|nr:GTPase Era [Oscillochloris sp.]